MPFAERAGRSRESADPTAASRGRGVVRAAASKARPGWTPIRCA